MNSTKAIGMRKKLAKECGLLLLSFLVLLILIHFYPVSGKGKMVSMNGMDTVAVYTKKSILYTRNILATLEPGEAFQVWHHSSGCFGSYGSKLEIIRHSGSWSAKLFNWEPSLVENALGIYKAGRLINAVTLDTNKLHAFSDFESEWPNFHKIGLSTTSETYTFFTRHLASSIECGYDPKNSFENLLAKFFHK
ncbi:MAG: hypothetical protein J7578_23065 [Chitinophagaceae bacterium]|nr:hypothetical protein [Chitinophagaceae bacterium]